MLKIIIFMALSGLSLQAFSDTGVWGVDSSVRYIDHDGNDKIFYGGAVSRHHTESISTGLTFMFSEEDLEYKLGYALDLYINLFASYKYKFNRGKFYYFGALTGGVGAAGVTKTDGDLIRGAGGMSSMFQLELGVDYLVSDSLSFGVGVGGMYIYVGDIKIKSPTSSIKLEIKF